MFRVLFFLILLLLDLLGVGSFFFPGFIIFISGFWLAESVCSFIVFSLLLPGVLLLNLSVFVFNCFCFFSLLCLSFGGLFLLFSASAVFINCFCFLGFSFSFAGMILFGLSLIWYTCVVVGPNLIFRWLFLFLLSSLYFLLFVFWRASIMLSIVSLSRDSLLLLLLCLSSDLDLFLLVWWCDVLGGGVLSCLDLLLSWRFLFSWFVLVVCLLSLLLELLGYLVCCFRIGFLGCVLSLFLDLELCASLYSELLELYLLLSSLLDGVLGLAWGLHIVSAGVSGVLSEMSIGPSACM